MVWLTDYFSWIIVMAVMVASVYLGHVLTKREYEYDYRKNTERQYDTLDGLKKWQQLEEKKVRKNADSVSKL
jgi:hypothetical protein